MGEGCFYYYCCCYFCSSPSTATNSMFDMKKLIEISMENLLQYAVSISIASMLLSSETNEACSRIEFRV